MESFQLSIELFKIYLKNDSELANTEGITAISKAMNSTLGALFYKNAKDMFKFSLSGSGFPISIPEERWRECIPEKLRTNGIHHFQRWAPPGIEVPIDHWIAIRLVKLGTESSYIFLGRDNVPWTRSEIDSLITIAKIHSEIIAIRYKRETEIKNRHDAEDALKLIQTRMEAYFEASHDAIYSLDTNGLFTSINKAGIDLFGVGNKEKIIGQPFTKFTIDSEAHNFFIQKIQEFGFIDDHELVIHKQDGDLIYCLESAHAVTKKDGSILEIQATLKDISERIKQEKELWKMNFDLSKLNQDLKAAQGLIIQQEKLASIGQLAAGVAHEINNPLGFLKSNQTMIRAYFNDVLSVTNELKDKDAAVADAYKARDLDYTVTESEHIFKESEEGFERIRIIVSHLLSFSRSSIADIFEDCDVNEGIESTLVVARNEIKYVAEVTEKLGHIPRIFAKKGELNQVILNILVNAAQAIASQKKEEKGNISIETSSTEKNIVIQIRDDGPGIPKEIQSRIFDPFFTTKEPGKGTGLGLSISYDIIVSKHHGSISVFSEPGNGTCFTITLPILPELQGEK